MHEVISIQGYKAPDDTPVYMELSPNGNDPRYI